MPRKHHQTEWFLALKITPKPGGFSTPKNTPKHGGFWPQKSWVLPPRKLPAGAKPAIERFFCARYAKNLFGKYVIKSLQAVDLNPWIVGRRTVRPSGPIPKESRQRLRIPPNLASDLHRFFPISFCVDRWA